MGWPGLGLRASRQRPFLPRLLVTWEWASLGALGCQSPAEAEQTALAQVYSPSLPPAAALPSSVPPYAPVSQPAVHFILQGSLPLTGGGVAQSLAPVPTILTTASEPAGHAAAAATATATNNSEERTAAPRPASEKARNEEVSLPSLQGQAWAGRWGAWPSHRVLTPST